MLMVIKVLVPDREFACCLRVELFDVYGTN